LPVCQPSAALKRKRRRSDDRATPAIDRDGVDPLAVSDNVVLIGLIRKTQGYDNDLSFRMATMLTKFP